MQGTVDSITTMHNQYDSLRGQLGPLASAVGKNQSVSLLSDGCLSEIIGGKVDA